MQEFIQDFIDEGLVSEKMVSNETPSDGNLPKVNDELPQTSGDEVSDMDDKEKDPNPKADEVHEDMMLKAAVKAVEAASCCMENVCTHEGQYTDEMKNKLVEMKDQCKAMETALLEMANNKEPDLPVENPPKATEEAVLHEGKKANFSDVNKYVQKELDKIAGQVKKKFNASATYVSTERATNVGGWFMKTSAKAFLEFLLPDDE